MRRITRSTVAVVIAIATPGVAGGAVTAQHAIRPETCWPPPVVAPIRDGFRAPACRWCPGNRGIDYATRAGQPVSAVAPGDVTFAGAVSRVGYVTVRLADGRRVSYGGLTELQVITGDTVVTGQLLGTAAGDTVHLGLRAPEPPPSAPDAGWTSGYLDPAPWLGRWRTRVRLVPVTAGRRPPAPTVLVCPNPDRGG